MMITYETVADKNLQKRFIKKNMKFMVTFQECIKAIFENNFAHALETINKGIKSEIDNIADTVTVEPDLQQMTFIFCGSFLKFFSDDLQICEGIFQRGLLYGKRFLRNECSPNTVAAFFQMVFEMVLLYKDKKGENDLNKARNFFQDGFNCLLNSRIESFYSETITIVLRCFYLLSTMYWDADKIEESEQMLNTGLLMAKKTKTDKNGGSESLQEVLAFLYTERMRRDGITPDDLSDYL